MTPRAKTIALAVILLVGLCGCARHEEARRDHAPQGPRDESNWLDQAGQQAATLDPAGRVQFCRELTRAHSRDPMAWTLLAVAMGGTGDYGGALKAANRGLRLDPDCAPAHLAKVQDLEDMRRPQAAAVAAFEALEPPRFLRLDAANRRLLLKRLIRLSSSVDNYASVDRLGRELATDPAAAPGMADILFADVALMKGDAARAEELATSALKQAPSGTEREGCDLQAVLVVVRVTKRQEPVARPFWQDHSMDAWLCPVRWLAFGVDNATRGEWSEALLNAERYYAFSDSLKSSLDSHCPIFPAEVPLWRELIRLTNVNHDQLKVDGLLLRGIALSGSYDQTEAKKVFEEAAKLAPNNDLAKAYTEGRKPARLYEVNSTAVWRGSAKYDPSRSGGVK